MRDRLIELLEDTLQEWECDVSNNTIEQIADHLIENGVIVPPFPVKVGDRIYRKMRRGFKDFYIREETVWIVDNHATAGFEGITKCADKNCTFSPKIAEEDIGKTVFLTREQAEKALAERSKNGKS